MQIRWPVPVRFRKHPHPSPLTSFCNQSLAWCCSVVGRIIGALNCLVAVWPALLKSIVYLSIHLSCLPADSSLSRLQRHAHNWSGICFDVAAEAGRPLRVFWQHCLSADVTGKPHFAEIEARRNTRFIKPCQNWIFTFYWRTLKGLHECRVFVDVHTTLKHSLQCTANLHGTLAPPLLSQPPTWSPFCRWTFEGPPPEWRSSPWDVTRYWHIKNTEITL